MAARARCGQEDPAANARREVRAAPCRHGRYVAVTAAYSAGSAALAGRTPGEAVVGLRVVGPDGRRPGPLRALARARLLPSALRRATSRIPDRRVTLGILGATLLDDLWSLGNRENRTLSEVLTGLRVVRERGWRRPA